MTNERIYNFSAGPSMLPESALRTAAAEMLNYGGSGMSVMEMSHRSRVYQDIFNSVKAKLKGLMNVPDTHEILFLQGGASLQFSMIPMNLMGENGSADYAVTGNFASAATKEAGKYGRVNIAADTSAGGHTRIPEQQELKLSQDARYFYYCANNTIYGTEWHYVPQTDCPLVCDMSSNILSKPVDVSSYGIIYAGAQKNMAPAGLTVVIIRKDLAGHELPYTPLMMSYQRMIDKDSMYNTPPCYNIYMLGLVLDWVANQGGLEGMLSLRNERSGMLYDYLDESRLFAGCAEKAARSGMNVTFRAKTPELEADFVKAAAEAGFVNLKGHRSVGGMRASIYNAMPVEGVGKLVEFMKDYEVKHHV
ncbi:MAG: 3-phosphoserine/phosphohydroxythreonine transaminase [Candidatus Heteroscillospira sp.]|jgi:phosphoserine aminotransferase